MFPQWAWWTEQSHQSYTLEKIISHKFSSLGFWFVLMFFCYFYFVFLIHFHLPSWLSCICSSAVISGGLSHYNCKAGIELMMISGGSGGRRLAVFTVWCIVETQHIFRSLDNQSSLFSMLCCDQSTKLCNDIGKELDTIWSNTKGLGSNLDTGHNVSFALVHTALFSRTIPQSLQRVLGLFTETVNAFSTHQFSDLQVHYLNNSSVPGTDTNISSHKDQDDPSSNPNPPHTNQYPQAK